MSEQWRFCVAGEDEWVNLDARTVRALAILGADTTTALADEGEPFLILEAPDGAPADTLEAVGRGIVAAIVAAVKTVEDSAQGVHDA